MRVKYYDLEIHGDSVIEIGECYYEVNDDFKHPEKSTATLYLQAFDDVNYLKIRDIDVNDAKHIRDTLFETGKYDLTNYPVEIVEDIED